MHRVTGCHVGPALISRRAKFQIDIGDPGLSDSSNLGIRGLGRRLAIGVMLPECVVNCALMPRDCLPDQERIGSERCIDIEIGQPLCEIDPDVG